MIRLLNMFPLTEQFNEHHWNIYNLLYCNQVETKIEKKPIDYLFTLNF